MRSIPMVVLSSLVCLQPPRSNADALPSEIESLCAYDRFCKNLQDGNGGFIPAKPEMVKVLGELQEPIRVTAHALDIDPRALAGAVLAENTMNVTVDGDVRRYLEKI